MEMEPDQGGSTATEIISGKMKSCSPGVLIHLLWKLISLCKTWGWLNSSTWKELQMNVISWLHLSLSPSDNPAGLFYTTSAAACVSSCEKYWQHCRQLVNSMHLLCYYRVSQKKVLIECCSSHGTPIQSPETGKMIFMNTWSWIWAYNSSCFMGATVIHNGVRTIKKRGLVAEAGHVVHCERAWHRTKVRLCSWLSRGIAKHPGQ